MAAARFLLPDRPVGSLEDWLALGGGDGLKAARRLGQEGTIDGLGASGLRGRGAGGHVTYDESQARKRPDWTYAPA